ncbi:Cytoskeleton protein RodZ [Usitatibacter rugosus]|uniref:Cytoskeleton protein RodZ n=1 Tax=Usitatibacter rugosus TaxID=2732067 RepID=A0A6M4GXX5_9PROT|nr:RodZ domain-containing protein [Usitatibacter rugosus]QJR11748.1 Cytoskeleton protein RodZ [Usitatibacter rugosus]
MSTLPIAGAALAAERERQNLSRSDVAQRLHMSVSQVEALETGDYSRLPRGTFLRGFVRNYAKVIGLDPNPILEALHNESPEHSRPGIVVASQNIRFDPLADRLANPYVKAAGIATVVVSVCFATMYWWLFVRTSPPPSAARKPAMVVEAPKAVEPLPAPVEAPRYVEPAKPEPVKAEPPPAPAPAKPAKSEPPKAEAAKAESAKAETAKAAPPKTETAFASPASSVNSASSLPNTVDAGSVVAAGGSVIRLKFRGTAWVEIKDGRGKVLLSRNQQGGSEAEVIGKGPFSVVVGNAPEVSMFLNDRPFDLEPHTKVAVARFTIN